MWGREPSSMMLSQKALSECQKEGGATSGDGPLKNTIKYFGVHLTKDLSWTNNIIIHLRHDSDCHETCYMGTIKNLVTLRHGQKGSLHGYMYCLYLHTYIVY